MPVKSLTNMVVTYNSNDISAYLNSASLEIIKDAIDTTNLASTAKENTPAAPGFSVPIGGFWMNALDAILGADAAATSDTLRALIVQIGPSGNRATYTRTATTTLGAFVSDYKVDASDPLGMIMWSATLSVSGVMTRT
jgi:hypothetical protein